MKKKKMFLPILVIMLVLIMGFSGCVTLTKDFDTLKVTAMVVRNGGDFTLSTSGKGGYELHVCMGTLSIEALEMGIDQQAIKTTYKTADADRIQYYRNAYGGGALGRIKGWWHRVSGGIRLNTVGDLALADGGGLFGFELPKLDPINTFHYLGGIQKVFDIDTSGSYTIPDYGLGVYSSTIPREKFPNNKPELGYLLLNNPDHPDNNGIILKPEGKNTGFVVWDGTDYRIIVLTNQPAFATDTPDKIWASCTLVKPNLQDGFQWTFDSSSEYLSVYYNGMQTQLRSVSSNLASNLRTAVDSAVSDCLGRIPNGWIIKSLSDVGALFDSASELTSLEEYNMEQSIKLIYDKRDIYKLAYAQLYRDVQGKSFMRWLSVYTINLDNGLSDKDLEYIILAYTGSNIFGPFALYDQFWGHIDVLMQKDEAKYYEDHDLQGFYDGLLGTATRVPFSGNLFSVQLIDDSYLGIFDGSTEPLLKYLMDIPWDEPLPGVNLSDLDKWRDDFVADLEVTIPTIIDDYISPELSRINQSISDLSDEIEAMNQRILDIVLELQDIRAEIIRLIPEVPKVKIFAYQVPSPVFTKILNDTGDFLQADPTASFSATVSITIGDTTNWTLTSGYPRAIVTTQTHGTLTIPLSYDSITDVYLLRQDMVGLANLSVGDTVKTRFEVKAYNGTGVNMTNLTATTLTYYTRIVKSWLSEWLAGLGLVIDDISNTIDEIEEAQNWLTYDDSPFGGANESAMDSFYAVLRATDKKGEELYIPNTRKNFRMKTDNDSQVLSWEVRIFENEPYKISIVVGNNTHDSIVSYETIINEGEGSALNPLNWGEKITRWWKKD